MITLSKRANEALNLLNEGATFYMKPGREFENGFQALATWKLFHKRSRVRGYGWTTAHELLDAGMIEMTGRSYDGSWTYRMVAFPVKFKIAA